MTKENLNIANYHMLKIYKPKCKSILEIYNDHVLAYFENVIILLLFIDNLKYIHVIKEGSSRVYL